MLDKYFLLNRGSIALTVHGKAVLMLENERIKNTQDHLFSIGRKLGFGGDECVILGNTVDDAIHHYTHAIAAYAQSGFRDASFLIIDGMNCMGGISIAIFKAEGEKITEIKTYSTAHSLGTLYAIGCALIGFPWHKAGKLMGASAYSEAVNDCPPFFLVDEDTGEITEDSGRLGPRGIDELSIEDVEYEKKMCGSLWESLMKRKYDFQRVKVAATVQRLFEQSVNSLLRYIHKNLPSRNLIISGGCGLNCVMNGKIMRSGMWNNLFVPNMCEDAGNIIGRMITDLGQKIDKPFIYNNITYPIPDIFRRKISKADLANRIRNGQIVAWFEEGSEYGPRALGHRSILANPRLRHIAYRVNEIKHREYWRPFAPIVLDTHFKEIFEVDGRIWYPHKVMLATEYIRPEWQRKIPAVCAPDNSSRPQVLTDNHYNHTLYSLMRDYDLPILLNTSMNDANEPICETPELAMRFCKKNEDVLLVFVKGDTIYVE